LLSGGQQQRVALARALVAKPAILLFDEPLSNLDRDLRETLVHTMADLLRSAGITAVYVTHDREEANTLADRIIHLAQGQIVSVTHLSGDRNAISQVS
jgi:iron(III) transport system ATP-binding protein